MATPQSTANVTLRDAVRTRLSFAAKITVAVTANPGRPLLLAALLLQPSPELDRFLDAYRAGLKRAGIVGASLAVLHGDSVAARELHGDAVRGQSRVTDDTAFHWASITKTFTAIAIMQLRDRGRLRLDDPVVNYVPELSAVHNPFGPMSAVTIRHLLTHSGGFRGPTWPWGGEKSWHPFEPRSWDQIKAMLPYTEVEFAPGSRYRYSNPGIIFLGQIIERLSGDDYEVYIDKNILKPLGMHRSYFDRAPYHLLPDRAAGYYLQAGQLLAAPFDFDTGITVSNGGLNAPVPDMLRYLRFLLGDPQLPSILKRSSLEEMFVKQMPIDSTDPSQGTPEKGKDWIGLSFFLHEENGRLYVGHGGQQGGFISHIFLDIPGRSAAIVAFNTDGPATKPFDWSLQLQLMRTVFPRLAGR